MLQRALAICAVLGLVSAAHAGVAITLAPAPNQAEYQVNELVNVDVLAQLTSGTPSVPGPAGTTTAVRVRLLQFDFSDSNPALLPAIAPVGHHPLQESQPFAGPIPFWDYSGSSICAGDEASCGTNYFVDGSLVDSTPNIVNTTYTGSTSSGSFMIVLNQSSATQVGEFNVMMPSVPGTYVLDVLNDDETDVNKGAELRWGFGSATDATDLTSPLRGSALTGGTYSFVVVPEPATLALLGLGGLAAAFRRRNA